MEIFVYYITKVNEQSLDVTQISVNCSYVITLKIPLYETGFNNY